MTTIGIIILSAFVRFWEGRAVDTLLLVEVDSMSTLQIDYYTKYLTYSRDDEKWQLYCTDVGSNNIEPYTVYPPHLEHHPKPFRSVSSGRCLTEYQIIYITKGHGIFISDGIQYKVIPGSVLFLFPGVKHSYKSDYDVGWTEYWIGFQGNYMHTIVDEGIITKKKPIYHIGFHHTLLTLFTSIFTEVDKQRPLYQYRIGAMIMMLIAEVISFAKIENQQSQSLDIVEKSKYIFDSNLYGFIGIEEVAEQIGISRSHLCSVFKSYTDMTPYQYFIHAKMNKAKEILEIGTKSIKEVAYELGYEDQYYFSRLFKKKTGVPPSKWRAYQ